MAMAYWSIYPMIASCLSWSEKLTSAQAMDNPIDLINPDNPENLVDCDTDHLRAFLVYSITTFLSGVGWFSRMTIDTVVDFVSFHFNASRNNFFRFPIINCVDPSHVTRGNVTRKGSITTPSVNVETAPLEAIRLLINWNLIRLTLELLIVFRHCSFFFYMVQTK